jgi:hypothetical protein
MLLETQTGKKVRQIQLDNTPEYIKEETRSWLAKKSIILQFTTTYTYKQVGKNKRGNHTILNLVRATLQDSGLPDEYWEFVVAYFCYCSNCTWSLTLHKTLYKEWFGKKLDLLKLKVFRSIVYVHIDNEVKGQNKLKP